jgi:hypothetical protein
VTDWVFYSWTLVLSTNIASMSSSKMIERSGAEDKRLFKPSSSM